MWYWHKDRQYQRYKYTVESLEIDLYIYNQLIFNAKEIQCGKEQSFQRTVIEQLDRGREECREGLQRITRKHHLGVMNRFIIDCGDGFIGVYVCQKFIIFYCLK